MTSFGSQVAHWAGTLHAVCPATSYTDAVTIAAVLVGDGRYLSDTVTPRRALRTLSDEVLLQLRNSKVDQFLVDVVSRWRDEGQRLRTRRNIK